MSRSSATRQAQQNDTVDLMNSVKDLKNRISLTERTLQAVTKTPPRARSSQSFEYLLHSVKNKPDPLTIEELQSRKPPSPIYKFSNVPSYTEPVAQKYLGYREVAPPVRRELISGESKPQNHVITSDSIHPRQSARHDSFSEPTQREPYRSEVYGEAYSDPARQEVHVGYAQRGMGDHKQLYIEDRPQTVRLNPVGAVGDTRLNNSGPHYNQQTEGSRSFRLHQQEKIISQLQEKIMELEDELKSQINAVWLGDRRENKYQTELSELKSRLKSCSDLLTQTEVRLHEQKTLINNLTSERDDALRDVASTNEQTQQLNKHIKQLQEKTCWLDDKVKLHEECKNEELDSLQAENEKLQERNKKLNESLVELEDRCEKVNKIQTENLTYKDRIKDLSTQLQLKDHKIIQLSKASHLRSDEQQGEMRSLVSKINSLELSLSDYRNRITELSKYERISEQLETDNNQLHLSLEDYKKKLTDCEAEFSSASDQLNRLETLAQSLQTNERITQTNSDTNQHEQTIHELKIMLSEKDAELNTMQDQVEEMSTKLQLAQLSIEAKNRVQHQTQQYVNEAEKSRHEAILSKYEDQINDYQIRVNFFTCQFKELEDNLSDARRQLSQKQNSNTDLRTKNKQIMGDVEQLKNKLAAGQNEKSSLQSKIRGASVQSGILEKKITSLRCEIVEKTEECDSYQREVNSLRQLTDQLNTQLGEQRDDFKSRIKLVKTELDNSKLALSELNRTLQSKQSDYQQLCLTLEKSKLEHQTAVDEFINKNEELSVREGQLKSEIRQCKDELNNVCKQLEEEKLLYNKNTADINIELKKMKEEVESTRKDLSITDQKLSESERRNAQIKRVENERSERIYQLESEQSQLQTQLSEMELRLSDVKNTHKKEIELTKSALSTQVEKTESIKIHINQLEQQIADLESEKSELKKILLGKEDSLTQIERHTSNLIQKLKTEISHKESELNNKHDMVSELETELSKMESELNRQTKLNSRFECEFRQAQEDLKQSMIQLQDLQDLLAGSQAERDKLSKKLIDTEEQLKHAENLAYSRQEEMNELDDQIRVQERQILERSNQVSQLDVSISSYRSDVQSQMKKLQEALSYSQGEISRKNEQIKTMSEHMSLLSTELNSKTAETQCKTDQVSQLQSELKQKSESIFKLEEKLTGLEEKSQALLIAITTRTEELEAKNSLLTQYEHQTMRLQAEITKCKTERAQLLEQLNRSRKDQQECLDNVFSLEQRLTRCETDGSRGDEGLESARKELVKLQSQHQAEIIRLEQAHTDLLESRRDLEDQYAQTNSEAKDDQEKTISDMAYQINQSNQMIGKLEAELREGLSQLRTSNEALVIKEGEIARLRTQVSVIERDHKMKRTFSTPGQTLQDIHVPKHTSPPTEVHPDVLNTSFDEISVRRQSVKQALRFNDDHSVIFKPIKHSDSLPHSLNTSERRETISTINSTLDITDGDSITHYEESVLSRNKLYDKLEKLNQENTTCTDKQTQSIDKHTADTQT